MNLNKPILRKITFSQLQRAPKQLSFQFPGYRLFKAVMFLSGLIFGSTAVYLICREERIFQQEAASVQLAAGN